MKPLLLIVEDDEEIRSQMKWALAEDYEILLAEDRSSALTAFRNKQPKVVLLDLGLPPSPGDSREGFAILAEITSTDNLAKVIIITGQGEKEHAQRAVGEGAYDFFCKPIQMEELKVVLKRCFYVVQLEREFRTIQQQFPRESFEGLLGTCPPMREVFNTIRKVANTDAPVLILGESGTGKEMVALAIHRQSQRKEGPFVPINCGAIPENLLESELFGHEKGSFTGAHAQRVGRIERASGGTLFLDEIGELPLNLQVKLLRFLQEQRIERVGGHTEIQINARVIAATNSDLKKAMSEDRFREDLFYRLAVVSIKLPPLRDRRSDIRLLAQTFLRKFAEQNSKKAMLLEEQALRAMEQYEWPGNVRELENRIKRAVIMAEGNRLTAVDLELDLPSGEREITSLKEARELVERDLIQKALQRHAGKITAAAAELGISRPTLYELMDKLGIQR